MSFRTLLLILGLSISAAGVPGCTGAGQRIPATPEREGLPALQTPAEPAPATEGLPLPSVLAGQLSIAGGSRQASYVPADLLREAEAFDAALPHQHVNPTAGGLEFDPGWLPQSPDITGLSFAMYSFNVKGYGGNPVLYYSWIDAPLAPTDVYFALADWGSDSWDWYVSTASNIVMLPGTANYIDFGGAMLVSVVAMGTSRSELDWLRLGSLPPVAALTSDFQVGLTPLTVQLDASGSTDPDSSIVEYRWDPEGDGTFSQSTGTDPFLSHEYTSGGAFDAAVKVVDNHGVFQVKSLVIDAVESVNFSLGAPDIAEEPCAVLAGNDNNMIMVSNQQNLVGGDAHPFVVKISPTGAIRFSQAWSGSGKYYGARFGPNDSLYVCGTSYEDALGNQDALLQKWSTDGELLWSKNIGDIDGRETLEELLIVGNSIYACGTYFLPDTFNYFGFLARFDLDGNLVWASTLIGPSRTWFHDLSYFSPNIIGGTDTVQVVGEYWPNESDVDCVFALYDTDGNRISCSIWGEDDTLDYGQTVYTTGTIFRDSTVTAIVRYDSGADRAMIGHPAGTTVIVSDASVERIIPWSMLGLNVGLIKYGARLSIVKASFDSAFNLLSQKEITAASNGACTPDAMAAFGSQGILFCGKQYSSLPVSIDVSLTVEASSTPWQNISPAHGSPSQLQVVDKSIDTNEVFGMELNRGAGDGDAIFYLLRSQ